MRRREFIKQAGAGAGLAAVALPGTVLGARTAAAPGPSRPFELGVATYSLREFSRPDAIEMIRALGATNVSVKSFHLPYELSPDELRSAANEFREAGLQLVSSGNNNIREDADEHVATFFDYAKTAGIPMLVIAPTPEVMPRVERFVKQYDIAVAIHNHGPEDEYFPAPSDALAVIRGMDPRVGLCVDVGHTARTGNDVVQEIADAGDRVLDVHMKDLRDLSEKDSQCAVGEGKMPVAAVFQQLMAMGYQGSVNLEYEINPDDPLPGMKESFAHMRGVLAGMGESGAQSQ